jgi:hypothetical protein
MRTMIRSWSSWRWAALLLVVSSLAGGCAATAMRPWDRDLMAQKKMRFVPNPRETAVDDHIYFSKEGSTGGHQVGGAGCGCN